MHQVRFIIHVRLKLFKLFLCLVLPRHIPPNDMLNNTVFLRPDLAQILHVDEKQGLWEIKIWMFISYQSNSARWNSTYVTEKNETVKLPSRLVFAKDTFWNPDIGRKYFFNMRTFSLNCRRL